MLSKISICGALIAGFFVAVPAAGFSAEPLSQRFGALDVNGDKKLTLEEFLKSPGVADVLKRDFRLFDWDDDKRLSAEEFDAILFDRKPDQRGRVPDPFDEMLNRALAQLDESYDHWDQNPAKKVAVNGFVQSFVLSFPDPNQVTKLFPQLMQDADENQDGRVDRHEARRFLEIQLGLRHGAGKSLHLPDGRVVRNGLFLTWDGNRDQLVAFAEFRAAWQPRDTLDRVWNQLDRNRNEQVDFDEFLRSPELACDDPIEAFRRWDTNLDAAVDEQEFLAGAPPSDQRLAKCAFSPFDVNGDKKLTLWEFRRMPQANPVLPWHAAFSDADRNGVLQFQEFSVSSGQFPLLRLIYFLRFDVNGSGVLEPEEFPFTSRPAQGLYRLNADGTGWKLIFSSPEYPVIGSPKISPDGKWLACDAIPRGQTGTRATKLLLMTVDGQNARELGSGMMPNWSRDGKKLTYSFANSIQVLDLETNEIRILVQGAWIAQWSPDGKKIAFTVSGALKTIDVETEEITEVVSQGDTPYQRIYWNIAWAPDSRRICFMGVRKNAGPELASVRLDDPKDLKVHYNGKREFSHNLAWSPDGKRIVFGMQDANSTRSLLHELSPDRDGEPVLLKGQDVSLQLDDPCWHPDGAYLIMQGRQGDQWTE